MKKLLEMKHWQLFCILVLAPLLMQFLLFITMFDIRKLASFFSLTTMLMLPFTILIYAWLWSIGISLNRRISADAKMKIGFFKTCMVISLTCVIVLNLFVGAKFIMDPESIVTKISFLLGPISFICILYCTYFNAKVLKTAEEVDWIKEGGSVCFSDYRNEFILFVIFPIGIWFIQPRLNKLVEKM